MTLDLESINKFLLNCVSLEYDSRTYNYNYIPKKTYDFFIVNDGEDIHPLIPKINEDIKDLAYSTYGLKHNFNFNTVIEMSISKDYGTIKYYYRSKCARCGFRIIYEKSWGECSWQSIFRIEDCDERIMKEALE